MNASEYRRRALDAEARVVKCHELFRKLLDGEFLLLTTWAEVKGRILVEVGRNGSDE